METDLTFELGQKFEGLGMRMKTSISSIVAAAIMMVGQPVHAEGDMTRRAERLDPLFVSANSGFSVLQYQLETGVYYRLRIQTDGLEEYEIVAPEFFPTIWINKLVIDDIEVKVMGLGAIEFEDEGEVDLWFIPIQQGTFEFSAEGLDELSFTGEFIVK